MPSTNTAGWLARRAGEMPSAVAVLVSIIATCWLVSFSYLLSGEPATIVGPIACTAPGEAASRLTVADAGAEGASVPVQVVACGSEHGHQRPAATTPLMWSAIASAPAGKPMAGLVSGAATSLAGPLSSTVTVGSARTVNWCEIWPPPVAVRPSTATNAPTPRTVPSMVSTARHGRYTIPATASAVSSRAVSREVGRPVRDLRMIDLDSLGQRPVADRYRPAGVGRHSFGVRDHHDRETGRVQLVEQFHQRGRVPRIQVPRRLVAQQQARPVS